MQEHIEKLVPALHLPLDLSPLSIQDLKPLFSTYD